MFEERDYVFICSNAVNFTKELKKMLDAVDYKINRFSVKGWKML